jgi:hypothetical protein
MTARDRTRAQLVAAERQAEMLKRANAPSILQRSHAAHVAELRAELGELERATARDGVRGRLVALFSGRPVTGSRGIDPLFGGKILESMAKLIKAGGGESVMLSTLPTGSFGFELIESGGQEILVEDSVTARGIASAIQAVQVAIAGNEEEVGTMPPGAIGPLRAFFEALVVDGAEATLTHRDGVEVVAVSTTDAERALGIVSRIDIETEVLEKVGWLEGVRKKVLDFEFLPDQERTTIRGKIDKSVVSDAAAFFESRCRVVLEHERRAFPSGAVRNYWTLKSVSAP